MSEPKQEYDVVIRTTAQQLGVILTSVGNDATLISVHPVKGSTNESTASEVKEAKTSRFVGGKRNKGITAQELALQVLNGSDRAYSRTEIENAFRHQDFAYNSVAPALSTLVRRGLIRRLGDGMYCLVGHTVRLGASASVAPDKALANG